MRKIKHIVSICCGLALSFSMGTIGILAAASTQVGVTVSVNYSPAVVVDLKMATNDADAKYNDKSFYYSGTGDFPQNAIPISNTAPVTIPDVSCNEFSEFILYMHITNKSPTGVKSSFSVKFGANESETSNIYEVKSQDNVNLSAGNVTNKTGIAKLILSAKNTGSESIKITFNLDTE